MPKVYRGIRTSERCLVVVDEGGETRPLHQIVQHSPDGFEWGYAGSGPADLALSLLADASGDEDLAERYYQAFKFRVVSQFPRAGWMILAGDVDTWLRAAQAGVPCGIKRITERE